MDGVTCLVFIRVMACGKKQLFLAGAYQRGEVGTGCVQGLMDQQYVSCLFPDSGDVLNGGQVGTNDSFCSPDCCSLFLSCSVADPNQTAMDMQIID